MAQSVIQQGTSGGFTCLTRRDADALSRTGFPPCFPYVARLAACLSNDDRVPDTGTGWTLGVARSLTSWLGVTCLRRLQCLPVEGLSCPGRVQLPHPPAIARAAPAPTRPPSARQTRAVFRLSPESSLASQTCKYRHHVLPSFQTSRLNTRYTARLQEQQLLLQSARRPR